MPQSARPGVRSPPHDQVPRRRRPPHPARRSYPPVSAEDQAQPTPPAVTQRLLRTYHDLRRQVDSLALAREELRVHIVNLIEAGAAVEPGRLTCRIRRTNQRRLSKAAVVAALGGEEYERLVASVRPSVQRSLQVFRSRCPTHPPEAGRPPTPEPSPCWWWPW